MLRVIAGGRDPSGSRGLLVIGASQVATLAGGLRRGAAQADAATVSDAAVAIWDGRIVHAGPTAEVEAAVAAQGLSASRFGRLDARGGLVTPGLVDPHTHLVFAGSREGELALRQRGAGYLEILAAGGGILSTVAATRAASSDELLAHGRRWLVEMLSHGTTTVEVKSGYGLDVDTELRLLDAADALRRDGPIDIVPTFLGAHAVPAELRERPDAVAAYVDAVVNEQLPVVAKQGIAQFADVFCEEGVFDAGQSRRILAAAQALGIDTRLHADELHASGGAELAADIGAASADHLAAISDAGIDALAAAADHGRPVVATVLPATTWFLMSHHYAPARRMIDRGIPVALGTDFNPGTSPTASLPLVMTVAALELGMTAAETLADVTINAAHALRLGDEIGSLEPGKAGDAVIWRVPTIEQIPYWPAADLVRTVIKRGKVVFERD